ncbi:MAG: hypothetical protein M5U10_07910 [Candidatus Methanoperedens sp.]|uniref:hypothetical protein n=1 Tax=Candidatus Methanoperedens nitratireducens TaxID=1392998 RepID=UPI0012FEECB1|nr:hypothetical protein [Candidatus Methanoperedens nitroreducens]MDJ1421826.1 hypothetical protein [Candidatus Methanoperedens sp.]
MLTTLKQYYRDPLYRNSITMMLNSAFGAFFGLLFWIVTARTMSSKGSWDRSEVRRLELI